MATTKISYASAAAITLTLTSLVNAAARASTAVDNSTNLYTDAHVRVKTKGQASGTSTLDLYVYSAVETSSPSYSDGATGTDAAFTPLSNAAPFNSRYLGSVLMNTTTAVVSAAFSVAAAHGGSMPLKWGIIAVNNSGATLSTTAGDHDVSYIGINTTTA